MFQRLGRDLEQVREHAVLSGSVRTEHPSDLPILVLVYTGEAGHERLVDYFVMAGPDGTIHRCKVRDPSFVNWPALQWAVLGNIIPDFPLINKSFNLSYAGNDL